MDRHQDLGILDDQFFLFSRRIQRRRPKNAMLVGSFIGDPLYSEDLHRMDVA